MMILENVRLALFSLKANKMRALLTMLGIIIGIASVIAIMTVGTSMTSSVTDSMNSMGANNITVGVQQKMDDSEREMNEGKKVALISDKAVNNLFGGNTDAAVGSMILVSLNNKYYSYTVVGVYKYEQSMMGFSTSSDKDITTNCLVPLKNAQNLKHSYGFAQFTVVTAADVDSESFATETEKFFNKYYENNRDFQVSAFSMASMVNTMSSMLSTITTAISVIAGIALLVGGIGVMNIMLVSITERTREIGTGKALGAPNGAIRLQFIVESMIICLIGGIIGILLGVTAGIAAANMLGTAAKPSGNSILLSLGFSMVIGIFFGYYPANKAAKMDPIEALRYE